MATASRSVLVERGPVNLGCGTLILIALIVLIFSSRPDSETHGIKTEIQQLQSKIGALQHSIDDQTAKLSRLEQQIRQLDTKIDNKLKVPIQPEAPPK